MKEKIRIVRFCITLEQELFNTFEKYIRERYYTNRSEAIRDLIRKEIVSKEWKTKRDNIAGAIVIVYNHNRRQLVSNLMDIQHNFHNLIISTQHIHLDHKNCLEVIVVKGKAKDVEELASKLGSTKGVKHCTLSKTTTGKNIL